jgi:arginine repressor
LVEAISTISIVVTRLKMMSIPVTRSEMSRAIHDLTLLKVKSAPGGRLLGLRILGFA